MSFLVEDPVQRRLGGLRRFAMAITILNLLGHTVLGFEQSWAHPLVSIATTYSTELILEVIGSWATNRRPRFLGGVGRFVDFLLPAHISGMAIAMLLYPNARYAPIVLAGVVAIASKVLLTANVDGARRHFMNPSNLGITVTLLVCPWVGIAPPYMFTEELSGYGDWLLPAIIVCSGSFLNTRFTGKLPLIASWLVGFASQAILRSVLFHTPLAAPLLPMTGMAFVLYTFYMVTDPATTPDRPGEQVVFGLSLAAAYCILMVSHIVFGLFFSLTIVCMARGLWLHAREFMAQRLAERMATAPRLEHAP